MNKSLLAGCCLAASALAAEPATWQYSLPDSGVAPSYAAVTAISQMGERHGGSRLGLQSFELTLPLSDPRKTHYGDWHINKKCTVYLEANNLLGDTMPRYRWAYYREMGASFTVGVKVQF
jgi:hypothetical protein